MIRHFFVVYLYKNDIIERTQAVLDCNLSKVIDVTKADYGRRVCRNRATYCYMYFDALEPVKDECQGKQRCSFTVTSNFLGHDPCEGHLKNLYVHVEYQCVIKLGTL